MPQRHRHALGNILPRIERDLGVGGEHRGFHRHGVGVGGDVVRQYQDGGWAGADEVPCDREDEVRVGAVHAGEEGVRLVHGQVRAAGDERGCPAGDVVLVKQVPHLRP